MKEDIKIQALNAGGRINPNDGEEVSRLASTFGVTAMDIRESIFFIGTSLTDIKSYLQRHQLMLGS